MCRDAHRSQLHSPPNSPPPPPLFSHKLRDPKGKYVYLQNAQTLPPSMQCLGEWESSGPHTPETPKSTTRDGVWAKLEGHRPHPTATPESSSGQGMEGQCFPLQGHDRVSSRFMYSCKAFKRASISAMLASWWSELYSVRAGMGVGGCEGPEATGCSRAQYAAFSTTPEGFEAGKGEMWSPRLTFDGDPAPRIS